MYNGLVKIDSSLIPSNACLVTISHRCGKSNCKCVRGHLHQANALKYRVDGIQKMMYIKKANVEWVKRKLYECKGIEIIERGKDPYIFALAELYPNLGGTDIMLKAYEVFGQQKLTPASLSAN